MVVDRFDQIADLWRLLSGGHSAFHDPGVTMVESDTQRLSPAGWIGVVSLLDRAVIVAPSELVALVEGGLGMSPPIDMLTTVKGVVEVFGQPAEFIGPAVLAYGSGPIEAVTDTVGPVPTSHRHVREILESCSQKDQHESGLMNTDSGVFISTDSTGAPVSASGYRRWPKSIAHMSVLTVPSARGAGHGFNTTAAAVALATSNGLLAQWRAADQNIPSKSIARSLGLTEIGRQFSFTLQ